MTTQQSQHWSSMTTVSYSASAFTVLQLHVCVENQSGAYHSQTNMNYKTLLEMQDTSSHLIVPVVFYEIILGLLDILPGTSVKVRKI